MLRCAAPVVLLLGALACGESRAGPPASAGDPGATDPSTAVHQDIGGVPVDTETAYKLLLTYRQSVGRYAPDALDPSADPGFTLAEAELPWLSGARLVHAEGWTEGGHAFFDPAWWWEEGADRRVLSPELKAERLDEEGYHWRTAHLLGCTLEAERRRAALFAGDRPGGVELESPFAELGRVEAEHCVDLLPRLLERWRAAHPAPADAAVAELAALWVRLWTGAEPYQALDRKGRELAGAEVRWWREVKLADPRVERLADVVRAEGYGTVRLPAGARQITHHVLELGALGATLTVENLGSTVVTIE